MKTRETKTMFSFLLAVLLVSTYSGCHGLPHLQQLSIVSPLSDFLNELSSKCSNAELVDLIQAQQEHCKVYVPPYTKSQYECMMFYDINKKLCSANQTLLPGNFTKRLKMDVTANDLCEQAQNWPVSDLTELPIYKKNLEAVLKNKEVCAAKLCGVEDMLSQDANYFCKYYKLGTDLLNGAITDTPNDSSQLDLSQGTRKNFNKNPGHTGNDDKDSDVKEKIASNGETVQAENPNPAKIQDTLKTPETVDGNSGLAEDAQGVGQHTLMKHQKDSEAGSIDKNHHAEDIGVKNPSVISNTQTGVQGNLNINPGNDLDKKPKASSDKDHSANVGQEETENKVNSAEHHRQPADESVDTKKDVQENSGSAAENSNLLDGAKKKLHQQHISTEQSKDADHHNADAAAGQNIVNAEQDKSGHMSSSPTVKGSNKEHVDNQHENTGQIISPLLHDKKQQDKQKELETNQNKEENAADQADNTLDANVESDYQDESDGVVGESLDNAENVAGNGRPSSSGVQHQQSRDQGVVDNAVDRPQGEDDNPSIDTGHTGLHQSRGSFIASGPGQIVEEEDDHFFSLFTTCIVMVVLLYVLYHNKSKVMGLIVEGRRTTRRRNSRGHAYKRLDTLEQAMSSGPSAPPSKMIY